MNDRQALRIPHWLEGHERRMKTKEAIEIDRRLSAAIRFCHCDVRPHVIISMLAVRHDDIQPIDSAALKDRNQRLAPTARDFVNRLRQPTLKKARRRSHRTKRSQGDAAGFNEVSSIHDRALLFYITL